MQLDLNGLPDQPVHVPGFGGEDPGVLELDVMSLDDAVFGYGLFFFGMSQTNAAVVLLDPSMAVCTSETSVNFNVSICCYIPEDSINFSMYIT
jgi:hypothetical protein